MNASTDRDVARELRQLELVDRIFGLEARLAESMTFANPTREQLEALESENAVLRQQLDSLRATANWRVGRLVLAPVRAVRNVTRRAS